MTSLSVSISCDGQTVPVISLTPPNYRNYRSIHYTYLKAAVMAHQNTPSQGQWKVRFRAKEREMCVTVITGRVASARQTLPPTTPVATVTPIQLDPEWALTTNTPVSHARSQPFPGEHAILLHKYSSSPRNGFVVTLVCFISLWWALHKQNDI